MKKDLELYIHIPFCVKKCLYCDFFSGPFGASERAQYFFDLKEEIREAEKYHPEDYLVKSIFFGGGTPGLVPPEELSSVMSVIRAVFTVSEDAEISIEANPGTVNQEKLIALRRLGFNRLSLGLQSADDGLLKKLGRIHTYEEFLLSFAAAREAGFRNINVDLMSGLPGETPENHKNTLKKVLSLSPEHLSCYSLIIAENTPFYALYGDQETDAGEKCIKKAERGVSALPTEEEDRAMYHDTKTVLAEAGYRRYEISNYAKPGFECRHNIGYWTGVPYLGFGAAAASFLPAAAFGDLSSDEASPVLFYRFKNAESLSYRCLPKEEEEELTKEDLRAEYMLLGLRMTAGVTETAFRKRFSMGLYETYKKVIEKYVSLGALSWDGEHLYFTDYGLDVSNVILREFI